MKCRWLAKQLASLFWMKYRTAKRYGCWQPVQLDSVPYLSILQLGKDLDRFKNLVLVHAARYAADLSYLPLMQELEKRYEGKLRIQTVGQSETASGSLDRADTGVKLESGGTGKRDWPADE